MTGRNWLSVIAVVWAILALPHPARPYGLAFVGAVIAWAIWKVNREDRPHDDAVCRCDWCLEQEKEEEGR
jgi:hypothetical protein